MGQNGHTVLAAKHKTTPAVKSFSLTCPSDRRGRKDAKNKITAETPRRRKYEICASPPQR